MLITGKGKTRTVRLEALLGALGAVLFSACVTEPAYLGVSDPTPIDFSCDQEAETCLIEGTLLEDDVRATFSQTVTSALPAPTWHYPLEDSIHPSNLGLLTLHFEHPQTTESIYEAIVDNGATKRKLYFPCFSAGGEGCLYQVPEIFWGDLARTFAGQTVTLSLRAGNESGVSEQTSLSLSFSPEAVSGGLYYWSSETRGVSRLVFGGREAVLFVSEPDTVRDPADNTDPQKRCAGCHAVSRDGSTIAYSRGWSGDGAEVFENAAFEGALRVAPVTDLNAASIDPGLDAPSDTSMMTLSSNGSRVVSAYNFKLELRDTLTGAVLDEVVSEGETTPMFPEFHPQDGFIALTLSEQINSEIGVDRGSIAIIPMGEDQFGDPQILVEETEDLSHYYPSWSPDGSLIAFVSGPRGATSYDQVDSRLRLVEVETGRVYDLDRATGQIGQTSTWPKFAPFSQCEGAFSSCGPEEKIFFLSYSSKRPYGLVSNRPGDPIRSQLWMSAIRVREGQSDPSSVPFWVPYQAPDTNNHLGYWTTALACNEDADCGFSQRCEDGECAVVVR